MSQNDTPVLAPSILKIIKQKSQATPGEREPNWATYPSETVSHLRRVSFAKMWVVTFNANCKDLECEQIMRVCKCYHPKNTSMKRCNCAHACRSMRESWTPIEFIYRDDHISPKVHKLISNIQNAQGKLKQRILLNNPILNRKHQALQALKKLHPVVELTLFHPGGGQICPLRFFGGWEGEGGGWSQTYIVNY